WYRNCSYSKSRSRGCDYASLDILFCQGVSHETTGPHPPRDTYALLVIGPSRRTLDAALLAGGAYRRKAIGPGYATPPGRLSVSRIPGYSKSPQTDGKLPIRF